MKVGLLVQERTLRDLIQYMLDVIGHRHVMLKTVMNAYEGSACQAMDLVIVETHLPYVQSDVQQLEEVGKRYPDVPLVFLVNDDLPMALKKKLPGGELLVKPFSLLELRTALRRAQAVA